MLYAKIDFTINPLAPTGNNERVRPFQETSNSYVFLSLPEKLRAHLRSYDLQYRDSVHGERFTRGTCFYLPRVVAEGSIASSVVYHELSLCVRTHCILQTVDIIIIVYIYIYMYVYACVCVYRFYKNASCMLDITLSLVAFETAILHR